MLKDQIQNCKRCPLHKDMPEGCKPVAGIGPNDAVIMFVGEALGEDESYLSEPFVGRCGKFLDKLLLDAKLDRSKIYITNVVKCRPTKNNGKSNRPPTDEEISTCKSWLWKEMQMVKPKIIVTLGKVPTYTLLSSRLKKSFKLSEVCGRPFKVDFCNSIIIPLYHPSYLMQYNKKASEMTSKYLKKVYNTIYNSLDMEKIDEKDLRKYFNGEISIKELR